VNCTGQAGWAQVNGRNAISWEEKFELDVWYVDKMAAKRRKKRKKKKGIISHGHTDIFI